MSPEKWEGLAVGPKLADGSYLVLAGTDNDYSVTQIPTRPSAAVQFDRYFKTAATFGPSTRIQCDIGTFDNCLAVNADGTLGAPLPAGFDFSGLQARARRAARVQGVGGRRRDLRCACICRGSPLAA